MATQKLYTAPLQALNALVLKSGLLIARIVRRFRRLRKLTRIEDVSNRGTAGFRIVDAQPFSDAILGPDGVVEINHIGRPVKSRDELHLFRPDAKTELQTVQ